MRQLNVESFCEKLSALRGPLSLADTKAACRVSSATQQQDFSSGTNRRKSSWRGKKKCGRGTKPAFAPWLAKRDIGRVKPKVTSIGNLGRVRKRGGRGPKTLV